MIKRPTLDGEIVKNPSASLSSTLSIKEKVEKYTRKTNHKLIVLRFLVGWFIVHMY